MKLWEKGIDTEKKIEQFTIGRDREFDLRLAPYDVRASGAHAEMLGAVGLLTTTEVQQLQKGLESIAAEIASGEFRVTEAFEDVHSQIEYLLTQTQGDVGKKIHTARSRNDQVLVAMQLYFKDVLSEMMEQVKQLFELLLQLARKHEKDLLPGYTHLQIAMPSSFGLWFAAYAELLIDDMEFLGAAYRVADQNPLGSAAGYGSAFPISRRHTTEALGFATMKYNVVAAQLGRGKVERSLALAMNSLGGTLGKLAMDICLFLNQDFDFIAFPEAFTTGSSIMPHKKNPDVFELIRARCNTAQGVIQQLSLLTNNLPSGYHRDLQLTKELIFPPLDDLTDCLDMLLFVMPGIRVREEILENPRYDPIFTVEALNELVSSGMPFRDAYKQVAAAVENGSFKADRSLDHTHEGSLGNLCIREIEKKMELTNERILSISQDRKS